MAEIAAQLPVLCLTVQFYECPAGLQAARLDRGLELNDAALAGTSSGDNLVGSVFVSKKMNRMPL